MIPIKVNNLKNNQIIYKLNLEIKFIYILFHFIFLIFLFNFKYKINYILYNDKLDYLKKNSINENEYANISFAILRRTDCGNCGLFSNYIVLLGCLNKYITKGYFPILDMQSTKNIFNKFKENESNENPWEVFFYQPFSQQLDVIKKKAKKIKYFECKGKIFRPKSSLFHNKILLSYWHNLAEFYLPIKNNILLESRSIFKRLFKNSNNILGILMRGTDYIAKKPKGHPIPPTSSMVIKDIKEFNLKNNYDWFFISTEDDLIRDRFIKEFGLKIKYLAFEKINYNYKKKGFLSFNNKVKGLYYSKIYLLNMIILSKCIDILSANTSGSIGVFIISKGFRYNKIYNLGKYK